MSEYIYERPDEPAKVVRDGWNVRIEWDFKQREKIVRCKDCARYEPSTVDEDGEGDPSWCWKWEREWVAEDGFCYHGERRER